MMRGTRYPTLAMAAWPVSPLSEARSAYSPLLRGTVLALAGTLALAVSAKANIPFYPVPLTLQTLVVLVLGAAFGARLAAATVLLYLAEGFVGLPVFAGAVAGPAYFLGTTAGFLVGFLAAATFVGFCSERGLDRSVGKMLAVMAIGHVIIFAFGFGWLAHLIGPEKAWAGGVAPFYWATLLKTALAAALVPGLWKLLGVTK